MDAVTPLAGVKRVASVAAVGLAPRKRSVLTDLSREPPLPSAAVAAASVPDDDTPVRRLAPLLETVEVTPVPRCVATPSAAVQKLEIAPVTTRPVPPCIPDTAPAVAAPAAPVDAPLAPVPAPSGQNTGSGGAKWTWVEYRFGGVFVLVRWPRVFRGRVAIEQHGSGDEAVASATFLSPESAASSV